MSKRYSVVPYLSVVSSFRRFLRDQGFFNPEVKRADKTLFPGGRFVVTFFDEFNNKHFCRSLTEFDMQCITHANKVFWRYMK